MSSEITSSRRPSWWSGAKATRARTLCETVSAPAESENLACVDTFCAGIGRSREGASPSVKHLAEALHEKVNSRMPATGSPGKSDGDIVPKKSANNGALVPAEWMEGRSSAKRKPEDEAAARTQSRIVASNEFSGCVRDMKGNGFETGFRSARHYLRQEPYAVVPHVRICAGGGWQQPSYRNELRVSPGIWELTLWGMVAISMSMPRKPRIEYAGAIYHVMSRGNRQESIFLGDRDCETFIEALGEACVKTGWMMHAFVLMKNHYHLLLETPEANLVAGMKWLQGTYTQRFNVRHKLAGHLLQGRYKAVVVEPSNNGYFSRWAAISI